MVWVHWPSAVPPTPSTLPVVTRSLVSRFVLLINQLYHIVDSNGPYTQVNGMDIITSKDAATVEFACKMAHSWWSLSPITMVVTHPSIPCTFVRCCSCDSLIGCPAPVLLTIYVRKSSKCGACKTQSVDCNSTLGNGILLLSKSSRWSLPTGVTPLQSDYAWGCPCWTPQSSEQHAWNGWLRAYLHPFLLWW